ncbi:hypothetical protein [Pseudomonas sp. TWI929]|uniref:hypothetical protein n=1 Tax=Pseudomonas sp. TWI929 TaxID=3136795 RepID=UPI00320B7A7B
MMSQLPRAWLDELNDEFELATDPEGRAAVLSEMAMAAHRRREVDADQLCEMLEFVDSARLFGLSEHEEMYACGLFKYHEPLPDWGGQIIKGVGKAPPVEE